MGPLRCTTSTNAESQRSVQVAPLEGTKHNYPLNQYQMRRMYTHSASSGFPSRKTLRSNGSDDKRAASSSLRMALCDRSIFSRENMRSSPHVLVMRLPRKFRERRLPNTRCMFSTDLNGSSVFGDEGWERDRRGGTEVYP